MKKYFALFLTACMVFSFSACGKTDKDSANTSVGNTTKAATAAASATGVINITEKLFVTYINEIYTNTSDYIGKTIQIEGMFDEYYEKTNGNTYYYVFRTGPGCCGNDGSMCGFEFTYGGKMPTEDDWIEVVGTLRTYKEGANTYLTLDASSVTVKDTRGAEVVQN